MEIAKYIDHTLLKADATKEKIIQLCQEAKEYHFASVCVNGCWAKECFEQLKDTDVKVCCVIGFPLGAMSTEAKAYEAQLCVEDGAKEIDMVINIGQAKDGNWEYVMKDIKAVKDAIKDNLLKVIIEACLLTDEEKVMACKMSMEANADYVKTSTGFSTSGAKVEDVALMKDTVKDQLLVKAAGGIHSYDDCLKMIKAGASRIGASAGVKIVEEAKNQ